MKARRWDSLFFHSHRYPYQFHQGLNQAKRCVCPNHFVKPIIRPTKRQGAIRMNIPTKQKFILLVDDELAIVKIIGKFLEKLGYHVISSTSAVKALQLFAQYADQIFLVITDLTMPDLCGTDLTKKIRAVRPEVPIILCTGYGETIGQKRSQGLKVTACLGKPITRDELELTVNSILEHK
jgi:CheY-like chemotaxis protein